MRHFLTVGHLDEDAVRQCRVAVLTPLDADVLERWLQQYRDPGTPDVTFENTPVLLQDGAVRCTWYAPRLIATSIRFVLSLQAETGCVIADIEHGRVIPTDELIRSQG